MSHRSNTRDFNNAVATGVGIATYFNVRHAGYARKKALKAAGYRTAGIAGAGKIIRSKAPFKAKLAGVTAAHAGSRIAAYRSLHPNQRNFETGRRATQHRVKVKSGSRVKRK